MIAVDIDLIGAPIFIIDVDQVTGALTFGGVNSMHESMCGIRTDMVIGHTPYECLPPLVAASVEARYRECVAARAIQQYDEKLAMPSGTRWWQTTLTPAFDPVTGAVVRVLGVAVDITERKRIESDLADAAFTDGLTGLFNRRRLELDVDDAMAEYVYTQRPFAIVLLDLDDFKSINDRFGHRKGDDVLRHLGSLLTMTARTTDTVARIGGDEFAIKIRTSSEVELSSVVTALRRFLDRSLTVLDVELNVGVSVGAALWQSEQTFEDLLAVADADMYREKALRRVA